MLLPLLSIFLVLVDSYKILVVNPKLGYSHMNFMGKIADTLADAGHDVVSLESNYYSILDDDELLEHLKAEKFDVGITELFDFTGIAVYEAIGLKNMIGTHASNSLAESTAYAIGAPVTPSFMPASQGITGDSTSFSTRAVNLLFTLLSWYFQKSAASAAESVMMKKLGKTATPIWVNNTN
ncbi:unnamed protein product [Cylicostephanus goldi]|uniref:glucuronosyltransferase n=1 Tax=Cylicostephanus goldi TaxID=71465 RepID=A0A3P6T083_CYLGO|nr:unnamed protein product [Cylicostephanus goldi]